MTRPVWDTYFMNIARAVATRSACSRLNVGCVLVRDRFILSTGMNGWVTGQDHVSIMRDGHEAATIHAEQNALCQAACFGVSVGGCTAYVTHYPCLRCAMLLAQAGVSEVVYAEDYRNDPDIASVVGGRIRFRKLIPQWEEDT